MTAAFYTAGAIAIAATAMMLTQVRAVHALLYLIASLLAVAVVFYELGAPFVAMLEVIIYAGAIMVLFIFVVMLLTLGERAAREERALLKPSMWIGPSVLCGILLAELIRVLVSGSTPPAAAAPVGAAQVGMALFGPYLIGVELASVLLLAGLVGAYHLGRRSVPRTEAAHAPHP